MARWRRIAPGGTVYHVLNRANNRSQIFFADADYHAFVCLLCDAARRTGMRVLAYCVMPNHWHLILWPIEDGALGRFVHWLTVAHAHIYRIRTDTMGDGDVCQGRYRSFPVQTEGYYYNVVGYVEANAFRAGLVNRAEEWRWSSLHERVNDSGFVTAGPIELPDGWVELVNQMPPAHEMEVLRSCAQGGRPYGSDAWIDDAAARCALEHTVRSRGRPRRSVTRETLCLV
jgi:putative transposase